MNDLKEIGGFIVSADPYVNHDNSLSGNGTLTSPLGVVPGYNETVLYESTGASANISVSEPLSAFEKIELRYYPQELSQSTTVIDYFPGTATNFGLAKWIYHGGNANFPYVLYCTRYILSGNSLTFNKADHTWFNTSVAKAGNGSNPIMISKIIGINRKQ